MDLKKLRALIGTTMVVTTVYSDNVRAWGSCDSCSTGCSGSCTGGCSTYCSSLCTTSCT